MPSEDEHWMRLALELAARGEGHVEPNPMVGCVLVREGRAIGQGFHRHFGGPHAEIDAIQSTASGIEGATAYVTLEPCCHHGKTPPCSEALIRGKVARVVVAMRDPFPKVDGGGIQQLRAAGIQVDIGVLEDEARCINAPYLKRLHTGMPWVIAKWAMTLDGKIATTLGESQWITGPVSRREVHRLRSRVDAIAVGMGTVVNDDPMLTSRLVDEHDAPVAPQRIAQRIVYCRRRLPDANSKLVQSAQQIPTSFVCSPLVDARRLQPLIDSGVNIIAVEDDDPTKMIHSSLRHFGQLEITNLMIEGGGELLGSFLGTESDASMIDECHVYVGGKLFGGKKAASPVSGQGIGKLSNAPSFKLVSTEAFDQDVRMIYRRSQS